MLIANRSILAILTAYSVGFGACGTPRPTTIAPCIKPAQKDLVIRWGDVDMADSTTYSFELNTKGELWEVHIDGKHDTTVEYLDAVDQAKYCETSININGAFLKTQALHSPGSKGRFIEYVNQPANVYLRAVWNPELQTFQSRDMREQYDSLMSLVPKD